MGRKPSSVPYTKFFNGLLLEAEFVKRMQNVQLKKEKALQQDWMVEDFMGKVCQCYLASHEAQRALKMESQNRYFLVLALLVVHDQLAIHELAEARQGKHQPAPA